MSKVVKKELGSFIKKLNKLKLADKIGTRGDVGEMQEEFISAIEEIDDAGKADKVDKEIIDYYEGLLEEGEPEKEPEKDGKDGEDEVDLDELKEELEDMSFKELKAYIEEEDLELETKITKKKVDDIIEEILELAGEEGEPEPKEKDKKKDKKADKKKDKKKDKKTSKVKGKLPKMLLEAIEEGDATWGSLAELVADEKDKEAEKCMGIVIRVVSRKISKVVPIVLTMSGDETEATFKLSEEE